MSIGLLPSLPLLIRVTRSIPGAIDPWPLIVTPKIQPWSEKYEVARHHTKLVGLGDESGED